MMKPREPSTVDMLTQLRITATLLGERERHARLHFAAVRRERGAADRAAALAKASGEAEWMLKLWHQLRMIAALIRARAERTELLEQLVPYFRAMVLLKLDAIKRLKRRTPLRRRGARAE